MTNSEAGDRPRANTVAVTSAAVLALSYVLLYGVLSTSGLTANMMQGQYPSAAEGTRIKLQTVASIGLTLAGYVGLGWAAAIGKSWIVVGLATISAIALVVYLPLIFFTCAVVFG